MKIFKFFFIAVAVFGLTACSSDDDNAVELTAANLEGSYELVFYEDFFELSQTASNGSTVVIETETCVGDTFTNANFTFNSDGTYTVSGNYREVCNLTVSGNTTSDSDIVTLDSSGNFSVNTSSRTITIDDDVHDVTLFDGTNLYLTLMEVNGTNNGETERYNSEIRFRKIN